MMFTQLRKLFKALNSSGKSWQISAAIVLAMFAGFLPASSLLAFFILFIALILNVNFGLFLLFSVVFGGIGYLFDPIFESLGYSVLTNESLKGFFTTLYNSVFWRWSAFNYTLITGSLIVSAVLALPMLFVLNRVVSLYRVQLGQKLNEWRVTRWMKLYNEEVHSISFFRWWGLGVFAAVTGLILALLLLFLDPFVRFALEKSLSYATQSQVTIEKFSSDLGEFEFAIAGIEVADRDKLTHNALEIKKIGFDLGFSALMEKKLMIENLDVDAMAFDRVRKYPAKAYGEKSEEEKKKEAEEKSSLLEKIPAFSLPSVDEILSKESLKSLEEAQQLKADIAASQAKWTKVSEELKSANEVEQIKADAAALQKSLKDTDISKIVSAKKDIDALKEKISSVKTKYTTLQKEFKADKENIQKRISQLKELPSADIDHLKKKYALNAMGASNVIGTLIGQEIGAHMRQTLKYYEMFKPYLSDADAKPEEVKSPPPPRGEGRWVKYANLSNIPEAVIKEGRINLELENDVLDVKLHDFSSNQKLYGKPMRLEADAAGKAYKRITAELIDDRRENTAKTSFDLKATEYKKEAVQMKPLELTDIVSDMRLKGKITAGQIEAKSAVNVTKASLSMPSQKMLNDLLSEISAFNVEISLSGEVQTPSIRVNSDLDKQLSGGLKRMASKANKELEEKLKMAIMKKVSASTEGLSGNLGNVGSLLDAKQDALSGIKTDFSSSLSSPLKKLKLF
jgi:uncharacterized protein (TIGR03545 family)/uncharacterized protein (TIGR03546 family)